jgi:hypothetical protein
MGKRLDTLERSEKASEKETSNTQYNGGYRGGNRYNPKRYGRVSSRASLEYTLPYTPSNLSIMFSAVACSDKDNKRLRAFPFKDPLIACKSCNAYQKPKLPIFSGEEKSETSLDVWKLEVKCVLREGNYTGSSVLQAISPEENFDLSIWFFATMLVSPFPTAD